MIETIVFSVVIVICIISISILVYNSITVPKEPMSNRHVYIYKKHHSAVSNPYGTDVELNYHISLIKDDLDNYKLGQWCVGNHCKMSEVEDKVNENYLQHNNISPGEVLILQNPIKNEKAT